MITGQQISMFDYDFGLKVQGYTNVYDKLPDHDCTVAVIDHDGNRFTTMFYTNDLGTKVFDATKGKGYDICWWKEVKDE